jgi:hypothetical protein
LRKKQLYTKAITILLTGVVIVFLFSCKKDTSINTSNTTPQQPLPTVVSFSTHIVPIFNNTCNNASGCHAASSPAAGLNLTAASAYGSLFSKYEIDTINPSSSNLYIEITNGAMPKYPAAPLTTYSRQLVLKWIQQKAKNN